MDGFFGQIIDSLENNQSDVNGEMNDNGEVRIFLAWIETWETKKIGPNGDAIFEARLVRRYGILKWLDLDNEFSLKVAHPNRTNFNKQRDNNK